MKQVCRSVVALAAIAALGADAPPSSTNDEANNSLFQKPIRLKAADSFIDSGPQWAHSGPCLHDVDGDGRRDLLVGDFSGEFRLYRNVGTEVRRGRVAGGRRCHSQSAHRLAALGPLKN